MTIAAGFVNHDGVLLAADTMTTDGGMSVVYQSKIIPVYFGDGKAFFAFSGEVKFSESAAERCGTALQRYNAAPRSIGNIAAAIRKEWTVAFQESHPGELSLSGDQIICAIYSEREHKVALCKSSNLSFAVSASDVECIGWGESVARYLVGRRFPFSSLAALRQRHVFEIAIATLARVKDFMPNAVGGNLIAVNLSKDGSEYLYGQRDIERIESYVLQFDDVAREMLLHFMDFDRPNTFEVKARNLLSEMDDIRRHWESALADNYLADIPPMEIYNIFRKARESVQ